VNDLVVENTIDSTVADEDDDDDYYDYENDYDYDSAEWSSNVAGNS
jgi:hypothetical protein